MRVEIRNADGGDRSRVKQVAGMSYEVIDVDAEVCGAGTIHAGCYCLDENQAIALVKALEAAISIVQGAARAVGR